MSFEGYIGERYEVSTVDHKEIPGTRFTPNMNGTLFPKIYLNISYTLPANAVRDGRVRISLMREDPNDSTFWFDIELPRGRTSKLMTAVERKTWSRDDVGRSLYFRAKAYGTSSCVINATSYISYSVE